MPCLEGRYGSVARSMQQSEQLWSIFCRQSPLDACRLCARIEHARLDFIWTGFGVLLTVGAIVEMRYKMGKSEHAERTLAEAERAYCILARMFSSAQGLKLERQAQFQAKFEQLHARLVG